MTFRVNGTDVWPGRLTDYLFQTECDDQIVLTDMTIPKGYMYSKKLSEATEADILKWIDFTVNNAALMKEVDGFGLDLDKLNKMFAVKANLSELQGTHVQVMAEFQELKKNMLEDIDSVPTRLAGIKAKY